MADVTLKEVWSRLQAHQGEVFRQIRGGEFRYAVTETVLRPDRTDWNIPRGHVEHALRLVPLANTVEVQHLFGPSYIYALLMDARIRGTDW